MGGTRLAREGEKGKNVVSATFFLYQGLYVTNKIFDVGKIRFE